MKDFGDKWHINKQPHWVNLDWNVRLEKEYQHMMLASLVFAS
jgi:hypothetical protein